MRKAYLVLSIVVLLATVGSCFAADYANNARLKRYKQILKNSGECINSIGTLFEVLIRHKLAERYPADQFEITGSLEYLRGNQTIGELDLLVFRKSDGKCVMVGEAKFWKNLAKAIKKAKAQLKRYKDNLYGGKITKYRWKPNPSRPFDDSQFVENDNYEYHGPKGAKKYGFTHDFDLSSSEGYWLLKQVRPKQNKAFHKLYQD